MAANADTALLRFTRPAMATTFELVFPWGTPHAERIAADAFDLIDRLEDQLTVYRDTSEISRLNRTAHQAPMPVERKLFELLQLCANISQRTAGAFDITTGPLIKAWGFYRRQGRVPSEAELAEAMACVGMNKMFLDDTSNSVRYQRQGIEINLGSIGKGYTLDRVGGWLREQHHIENALLHAGTSSVLAIGNKSWPIGVKHPHESRRLGTIKLRNRAMASSGAAYQHFSDDGRKLGHLLDPRTGHPIEGMALAVALAPTAAEADALATAFYVLGIEKTRDHCGQQPDLAALLVPEVPSAIAELVNIIDEWMSANPNEVYVTLDAE